MSKTLIAIDPGSSGAICLYSPGSAPDVMPWLGRQNAAQRVRAALACYSDILWVIEQVHASPIMGQSSAFKFGRNFGLWEGIAEANGITLFGVTPQTWQRPWATELEGLTGSKRKSALLRIARRRYAKEIEDKLLHVTLETCDALLMAHYLNECANTGRDPGLKIV